jgi:hypothetical protein
MNAEEILGNATITAKDLEDLEKWEDTFSISTVKGCREAMTMTMTHCHDGLVRQALTLKGRQSLKSVWEILFSIYMPSSFSTWRLMVYKSIAKIKKRGGGTSRNIKIEEEAFDLLYRACLIYSYRSCWRYRMDRDRRRKIKYR